MRATRYLKNPHGMLTNYIRNVLPFCDLPTAMAIYEKVMSHGDADDMALLGCNDRFFLMTQILKRSDLVHPWLYYRTREVELEPDGFLDLWAREHGKTSIITIGGVIQEIMVDPNLTAAIFSVTQKLARKVVAVIMKEFSDNELLKETYSDVLWKKPHTEAPRWSVADGIVVKRTENPKEGTVEGWGLVDGMPTGGHYHLLVYDDIITQEYVTNPDMVRKATDAWELSDNLGRGDVRKWHAGTRYSFADSWGQLLERRILKPRIYPATDDGTPTGKPVLISQKRWNEKVKTQRSTLNAQMLQNPIAGTDQTFKPEWFEARWDVRPPVMNVYIMVDPSGGRKHNSDRTAMAVVGITPTNSKYLLDGYCHRMTLTERWDNMRNLRRRWMRAQGVRLVKVGYEKYGMQADIEVFKEKMEETGEAFEIIELNWPREGSHAKQDRIGRLEPDFRDKNFILPALMGVKGEGDCYWYMEGMKIGDKTVNISKNQIVTMPMRGPTTRMKKAQEAGRSGFVVRAIKRRDSDGEIYDLTRMLIDELLFFPFAPHDDLADAVSRIYDMDATAPLIDEQNYADEVNAISYPDS